MTLKIHVKETIRVCEKLQEAENFVIGEIRRWFLDPNQKTPLKITLEKIEDRGPPTLGIHVSDVMDLSERFG